MKFTHILKTVKVNIHNLDDYFGSHTGSRLLFNALSSIIESLGESTCQVTKSQVAFRRKKAFAWAWMPGKYLHGKVAPLVLSISLPYRDPSLRWKEINEPSPGQFMHHLELYSVSDLDGEVCQWLRSAWENTV